MKERVKEGWFGGWVYLVFRSGFWVLKLTLSATVLGELLPSKLFIFCEQSPQSASKSSMCPQSHIPNIFIAT